jgi:hypothetical protein
MADLMPYYPFKNLHANCVVQARNYNEQELLGTRRMRQRRFQAVRMQAFAGCALRLGCWQRQQCQANLTAMAVPEDRAAAANPKRWHALLFRRNSGMQRSRMLCTPADCLPEGHASSAQAKRFRHSGAQLHFVYKLIIHVRVMLFLRACSARHPPVCMLGGLCKALVVLRPVAGETAMLSERRSRQQPYEVERRGSCGGPCQQCPRTDAQLWSGYTGRNDEPADA